MKIADWHQRFEEQAHWTQEVRHSLFEAGQVQKHNPILEVGCGTGAILKDFERRGFQQLTGIDINRKNLIFAATQVNYSHLLEADAHYLPFDTDTFQVVYCHFLLLWVNNPSKVVSEMVRVTKRGGQVMIFAEPAYQVFFNVSDKLAEIQVLQIKSLKKQGANPFIGNTLEELMRQTSLVNQYVGQIQQKDGIQFDYDNQEANILTYDLSQVISSNQIADYQKTISEKDVKNKLQKVSTFYSIGFKP